MNNINKTNFPTIDLEKFGLEGYILREKNINDAEDFLRYFGDKEVNRFILCNIPQNIEESRREVLFWRNVFYSNDGIYFAIARKDNNQMIGSIGLNNHYSQHHRIELSYDLAKEYWRKGVMQSAISAIVDFGFNNLEVNRIEAFMAVDNIPSKNLLLKLNFTLEGILREHRFYKEKYWDVFCFSLLAKDKGNDGF